VDGWIAQYVVGCAGEEGSGRLGAGDDEEGGVCEDFAGGERLG